MKRLLICPHGVNPEKCRACVDEECIDQVLNLNKEARLEENAGIKTDEGKLRWHLMPFDALEEVARVMDTNAQPNGKYPERNWEKGISYSRLFSAALRHTIKWFRGEENDQESGLPHLAHASCCILFLLAYTLRAKKEGSNLAQFDDRPKGI